MGSRGKKPRYLPDVTWRDVMRNKPVTAEEEKRVRDHERSRVRLKYRFVRKRGANLAAGQWMSCWSITATQMSEAYRMDRETHR